MIVDALYKAAPNNAPPLDANLAANANLTFRMLIQMIPERYQPTIGINEDIRVYGSLVSVLEDMQDWWRGHRWQPVDQSVVDALRHAIAAYDWIRPDREFRRTVEHAEGRRLGDDEFRDLCVRISKRFLLQADSKLTESST